jgi:hypothetical protein
MIMRRTHDSKTCPNCSTLIINLSVECDEEGGYVALKVTPCTGCGQLLCASCDFAACDGCGNVFCADCLVHVEDGSEPGLQCCRECAAIEEEPEQELLPLAAMVSCAAGGSSGRTVQDDTFHLGLERPVCCETGIPMLGVA